MKISYYVNKDARKVICVFNNTKYDFDNMIENLDNRTIIDAYFNHNGQGRGEYDYHMKNSYSGVASCSDTDEWNEELGRMIAYDRARRKYDMAITKRMQHLIDYIDKSNAYLTQFATSFCNKANDRSDARYEKIHEALHE